MLLSSFHLNAHVGISSAHLKTGFIVYNKIISRKGKYYLVAFICQTFRMPPTEYKVRTISYNIRGSTTEKYYSLAFI